MRKFYAVYDKDDNFITCGYSAAELNMNYDTFFSRLHRNKGFRKDTLKVFEIPLLPQQDIFELEDKIFLEEENDKVFYNREIAQRHQISLRTYYKKKKKNGGIFPKN